MTMITPSYLGETIEYSSLHACRSTLEDPTARDVQSGLATSGCLRNFSWASIGKDERAYSLPDRSRVHDGPFSRV